MIVILRTELILVEEDVDILCDLLGQKSTFLFFVRVNLDINTNCAVVGQKS